jgi:hypothetical protein
MQGSGSSLLEGTSCIGLEGLTKITEKLRVIGIQAAQHLPQLPHHTSALSGYKYITFKVTPL